MGRVHVGNIWDVDRMKPSESKVRTARVQLVGTVPAMIAVVITAATAVAAESIEPFAPGKNAALVKRGCSACPSATLVVDRTFSVAEAKKYYRLYVGNPDSDEGKLVVEYLSTVLGEDAPAGQGK